MIRINLLPFRAARRKENLRQHLTIFALSIVMVSLLLLLVSRNLSAQVEDLNIELESTNKEFSKFQKKNFEIAGIKRELKILNDKIGVIETLESNREGPVRLLDAMTGMVIPRRMWFTSLEEKQSVEAEDVKTTTLRIDGLALDNKTVAEFMERLEGSKLFSSVNLMNLQQEKKTGDLNLKEFQIDCKKVSVEPIAAKDGADKK
ncbi:MAG: PilN domain-containing protein [Desulfobacterales bacterium]